MTSTSPRKALRALAQARRGVIVPGAFNALSARVIADTGFGNALNVIHAVRTLERPGADILFVEAVTKPDEVRALPARLDKPQLMNMVIGGRTPIFGAEDLAALGYGFVLYANATLQGALAGMSRVLTVLRDTKRVDEDPQLVAPFAERQRLVGKPEWDRLEERYRS